MAATIFATMEVALKIGGVNLDSFQLTAVRFLIGGLILAPAAYFECRKSGYRLNGKDVAWMALLGIVGARGWLKKTLYPSDSNVFSDFGKTAFFTNDAYKGLQILSGAGTMTTIVVIF